MPEENGSQQPNPTPPQREGPNLRVPRSVISWLLLLGLAMLLVLILNNNYREGQKITVDQFNKYIADGWVTSVTIKDDATIEGTGTKPSEGGAPSEPLHFVVKFPPQAIDYDFMVSLQSRLPEGKIEYERKNQFVMVLLGMLSVLPWLLFFGLIYFFVLRQVRNAGGPAGMLGNFGRSRHRVNAKEHTNVTFADVAGIDEAKEEVHEIIEFLKSPKKFQRLGGRIPRGVLLVGEPGCGKTLLAKAIAGEADVPFFSISGSDFVEMFVGVGASRVRDLFKQAKENSPCIIFLDEIDAVGRRRGASFAGGGGHDEREQTLNAILVEMDGFDTHQGVIVIAATNRVDVLDPALVRPGRFDRQVYVSLPDVQGRYEILKVHARKIKMGPNVDMRRIARGTPMFSGADLEALVNESALIATMRNKDYVEQEDLEEARDKVRWGRAKKNAVVDEHDRTLTSYHEAGHALVQALERHADPLHKVSIIPRGPAAGVTFSLPEKDRKFYTRDYLLATLRVLVAGRIAEDVFFSEVSSGASSDIRKATEIARRMVRDWGMSERVGFIFLGEEEGETSIFDMGGRNYSDKTAEVLDAEMKLLIDEAYADARKIIDANREKLERIAAALLKYETISGDEVNALIRGDSLDRASVTDLLDRADTQRKVGIARPVQAEPKPKTDLGGGPIPQPG